MRNTKLFISTLVLSMLFPIISFAHINDSIFNEMFGKEQISDSTSQQKYFAHYFAAQDNILSQNYYNAEYHLKQCAKSNDNAAVNLQLYKLFVILNNDSAAYYHINRANKFDPNNEVILTNTANLYWKNKKIKSALDIYKKLNKINPNNTEYIYNIIYATKQLMSSGQIRPSLGKINKYLAKLEKIDGYSEELAFEYIKTYLAFNTPSLAINEIKTAQKKFPFNIDFIIYSAQINEQRRNYKAAINDLNYALVKDPGNGNIIYYLSEMHKKNNETEIADSLRSKALYAKNTNDELRVNIIKPIITDLYEQKNSDSIYNIFNSFSNKFPENKKMKEYFISFLIEEKDTANIIKVSKELIDQDPENQVYAENILPYIYNDTAYRYNLVNFNDSIHDNDKWKYYKFFTYSMFDDSVNVSTAAQKLVPKIHDKVLASIVYGTIGDFYKQRQNINNISMIYEMYDSALAKNPDNPGALNNYAYTIYEEKGDINKAEKMSARSIQLEPNNIAFLDTYARILFIKKEYFLAKFYIERIFANDDEPKSSYYEIYGDILFLLGQTDKAIAQWELAVKANPKNEKAKLKLDTKTYHE